MVDIYSRKNLRCAVFRRSSPMLTFPSLCKHNNNSPNNVFHRSQHFLFGHVLPLTTVSPVTTLTGYHDNWVLIPQGLEPRGTDIGNRLAAWAKLQENTGPGKPLSLFPQNLAGKSASGYERPLGPWSRAPRRPHDIMDMLNMSHSAFSVNESNHSSVAEADRVQYRFKKIIQGWSLGQFHYTIAIWESSHGRTGRFGFKINMAENWLHVWEPP